MNYTDGRFAVQFNGMPLSFRVFDKIRTVDPGTIVENKRLGAALALVKQQQAAFAPHQRRKDIARQRPPNNLDTRLRTSPLISWRTSSRRMISVLADRTL